jgi:hypothetical protein
MSPLAVGPPPKEVDCKAVSKGPPTLKYCAVSPKLSNDWLKSVNEGAKSMELVGSGGPLWLFGLRCGYRQKEVIENMEKFSTRVTKQTKTGSDLNQHVPRKNRSHFDDWNFESGVVLRDSK